MDIRHPSIVVETVMRIVPTTLSLAGVLLTGCAVGPNYVRPQVETPSQFMGQAALSQRRAAPAPDLVDWWEGFNDPVLIHVVEEALAQNLDLAKASARVTQARAALRGATAALLPSGAVTGAASRVHASEQTALGEALRATPGFQRDGNLFEVDLAASWEIDLFGGLRRGREASLADYQAARADEVAARLAIAAQTADTYVVIRGLQARIAVAKRQIDTQRRLLATVELQYDKGVAAELQLRQAEGALSQVEATLPGLEDGLESSMNALDVLLGSQPGAHRAQLTAPGAIPSAPEIASAGGPADLLRRRPDIIVAERRVAAANARIGEALAEYYPKISLSGLIGTVTTLGSNLFSPGANQAQGTAGLRWRLFDFGRIDAEVLAAKGQKAEALAAYKLSVLRATEDVEDAFSALVKREDQERTLARGEASLTRAREISETAYKGGAVSLIEVLDADSRLLATRDARALAQTEAARAAIASFRALGGGWDAPAELPSETPRATGPHSGKRAVNMLAVSSTSVNAER